MCIVQIQKNVRKTKHLRPIYKQQTTVNWDQHKKLINGGKGKT